jgi:hypothetical protein
MNAEPVPMVSFAAGAPEKVDINLDAAAKDSARSLGTAWGRIKKVMKRFGPFWQDSVTQITYIVPQFIAYQKLEEMAKAESCNSEEMQRYEGTWAFTYESSSGKRIVESIGVPLNLLLAFMILQQFVFLAINILKVRRKDEYMNI